MKQTAGGFRGSRLVVATVVLGMAGTVALSADGSSADAQSVGAGAAGAGLNLPPLSTPQVSVPSIKTPIGSTPQITVPPISTPQVTVPAPTPSAPLPAPTVTVAPVKPPSVSVPKPAPAPSVSAPSVQTPTGSTPSVTVQPNQVRAPAIPGTTSRTPPAEPGAPSARTGSGSTAGAQPSPVGGAGGGSGSLPSPPQGGDAPAVAPARTTRAAAARGAFRNMLLRRGSDAPLRGKRLRVLRSALRESPACFAALPEHGQRALSLRAGLGDREPTGRRAIARKLDVPLKRELSIERSSLRQLAACGAGGAAVATAMGETSGAGGVGDTPAAGGGYEQASSTFDARDSQAGDRGGVLSAVQSGPVAVPVIDVPDDPGAADALVLLALALLGPLVIALLAGRSRRSRTH